MEIIGTLVLVWGVLITIFGILRFKKSMNELQNGIEIPGRVIRRRVVNLSPAGVGWQVTIEYKMGNELREYTPKSITFPLPMGVFIQPVLLYRDGSGVVLKSAYVARSRVVLYVGITITILGILLMLSY